MESDTKHSIINDTSMNDEKQQEEPLDNRDHQSPLVRPTILPPNEVSSMRKLQIWSSLTHPYFT